MNKVVYIIMLFTTLLSGCGAKNTASTAGEVTIDTESAASAGTALSEVKTDDMKFFSKTDATVDVKGFKTYAWYALEGVVNDPNSEWTAPDLNIANEIAFLVDRELRGRGMTEAAENPDVLVGYSAVLDMKASELMQDKDGNMKVTENIPKTALIVAFQAPADNEVVWIGAASATPVKDVTAEVMKARLDYAVTKIIGLIGK